MLILGLKGENLDQKGPKMGGARFFQNPKPQFSKKDHKISFYTKNQQTSMSSLEDISQNVYFGPKKGKFGPKRPKMGGTRFFPVLSLGYFINRPKI